MILAIGGTVAALMGTTAVAGVLSSVLFRRVVPADMVHTVQSRKKTVSFGKDEAAGNVYWAWPSWVPVLGVGITPVSVSIFQLRLDGYEAYDNNKVPFKIDVVAFFQVTNPDRAIRSINNVQELKTQLTSVLQGAVRAVLAKYDIETIMQDRTDLGEAFTSAVNTDLDESWGVKTIKTIEFMDIRDADGYNIVQNIMAKETSRIDMDSRIKVAGNMQEAKLKEIDAKRTVDVREQDALQQVGIRTAEKDQIVGIANEQSRQEILVQTRATAERQMEVQRVNEVKTAEITKDVNIVQAEAAKTTNVINAEAAKQTTVINAEASKQNDVLRAEAVKATTELTAQGDLAAARNEAEGIQAIGEAKAKAEEALLMAPVTAQITLAKEIGDNPGYQNYLVTVENIKKDQAIGVETAAAYGKADIKIIASGGNVAEGVSTLGGMLSPAGGTALGGMLTALEQTPVGKAVIESVTGAKAAKSPK